MGSINYTRDLIRGPVAAPAMRRFHVVYRTVPPGEITGRIARLQDLMEREGFHGALILQKVDLYYFSGTNGIS
jgi:hypothetical protein